MSDPAGSKEPEPIEHLFSATLRIFGEGVPFDEIEQTLGLEPTHRHERGEEKPGRTASWQNDMWSYQVPVERERPAVEHVDALWRVLSPHTSFLRALKNRPGCTVDIYLSYFSNWPDGGVVIPHRSLEMFTTLEVPFGLSIIATGSADR